MSATDTGMRVTVDGTTHPIHDAVPDLSVFLRLNDGRTAEIKIANMGEFLNVTVAGQLVIQRAANGDGVHILNVIPTE